MARYTAAVVGCGSIGNAHMEGYNLVDNVEVIAVADPIAAARKTYMDEYDIAQEFETVEEMMEKAKPDIVSVCTWHLLHPGPTVAAAKGGAKAVICEKPMAIGMAPADQMVDGCQEHGTKLVISHQRRFTPGWEKAKAMLEEGAIGTPVFVTNKVAEGLTNWGTHSIDGSRFVLGDPKAEWVMGAVERRTDRYERDTLVEDACMGLVHFDNGIQLFIQSDLMREGATAGSFEIRGSEGLLNVSETKVKLMNATSNGWQDIDLGLSKDDKAIGGNTNAA
ncbi:MAG TPA: Gfo/Idh/MocA family oxidoreductase, partial [Candidatus Latescibacteria bacterium]|nr:Gfo/Idh/MocA family oxidoreductase [Candidatus Latescibacterota bacterium]